MEPSTQSFDSRAGFGRQLQQCLARARLTLQLFDRDFSGWELGSSEIDALLRHFLAGGGHLQLVAHSNAHLERHAPRLLRLLRDYAHAIECRLSPASLQQLTDSFCVGDGHDLVRRFHADHWRGAASFAALHDNQAWRERFTAIWHESGPGLHASSIGL